MLVATLRHEGNGMRSRSSMQIRPKLERILDRALAHESPSRPETAWLIQEVHPLSPENDALMEVANRLTRASSGNHGEIHAQIGVNLAPCPHDCGFCSFAAQAGLFKEQNEITAEEIAARARRFVAEGANAIYLMTTGSFDFASYLRVGEQVRASLPMGIPLVANVGDMSPDQARRLVEVGFQGAYHVVRMGEGRDTGISPKQRVATMRAILDAGLRLAYCVEPIGPEHTIEEIVDKVFIGKEYGTWFSGAMRRIAVPGTALANRGMISELELAKIVAVSRLVMADSVHMHCTHEPNAPSLLAGANLLWAESGSNPRDRKAETTEGRGLTAAQCGQLLREMGFTVRGGSPASLTDGNSSA
jgi:biotin synthase